jgi:hypothetical protein
MCLIAIKSKDAIALPFCCTAIGLGLTTSAITEAKKKAKSDATAWLLELLHGRVFELTGE